MGEAKRRKMVNKSGSGPGSDSQIRDFESGPTRLRHLRIGADRLRSGGADTIVDYLKREAKWREVKWEATLPLDKTVNWISPYHMVLDMGLCFQLTFSKQTAVGRGGECFDNAYAQVRDDTSRWVYCEGFAICDQQSDPVQHAWVFDTIEGRPIEITWPPNSTGILAVGVPINAEVLLSDLPDWKNMLGYHYENGKFSISRGNPRIDDWWHNALKKPSRHDQESGWGAR